MEQTNLIVNALIREVSHLIKNKRVIFIGEIHGTKEIPSIVTEFLKKIIEIYDFDLALELPVTLQEDVNKAVLEGDINLLSNSDFFRKVTISDGRNSQEIIEFMASIYELNKNFNKNINVYCIDSPFSIIRYNQIKEQLSKDISKLLLFEKDQNKREEQMSEEISKVVRFEKKLFVLIGNLHASKSVLNEITPTAYLLSKKQETFSINLKPSSGKFYNSSIKTVKVGSSEKKLFDYTLDIGNVSPCTFLMNMTGEKPKE